MEPEIQEQIEDLSSCESGDIEIVAQVGDHWRVRITFPVDNSAQMELIKLIRSAKSQISHLFGPPVELLEFREILSKTRTIKGIVTLLTIGRKAAQQGKPVVRLHPEMTERGELLQDMTAEVDFFYLDEFDAVITLKRMRMELEKAGVSLDLCDLRSLEKKINQVSETQGSVAKFVLAQGKLPSGGQDAELEYTFHTDPESAADLNEYRLSRKVKEGDVICQKVPPKDGKEAGWDVRGEHIPPIRGLDFKLVGGEGVKVSLEGTRVTALRDGIALMSRTNKCIYTLAGDRIVPDQIEVRVKPLVELNADDVINMVLEDSIEISGNLKEGSVIDSRGEIYVRGDVNKGSKISAGADVLIDGDISGCEVNTDRSLFGGGDANKAKISAQGDVTMNGIINQSEVSGSKIKAQEILGSKVEVGTRIEVGRIGNDASGQKTSILLGRKDFYNRQIEANRISIDAMSASVDRIRTVFGEEILGRLSHGNIHHLLLEHIKKLHGKGISELDEEEIQALKQLMESVVPLQNVLEERTEELQTLKKKALDENASRPIVVIREKLLDAVDVTLKNKTISVGPTEGGSAIKAEKDGSIKTYPLKEPKIKKAK
ncbi:MAG: FapA family protein [bacterium]|nr:FapA family protein [bacterium]